jgi:hypothetical protein
LLRAATALACWCVRACARASENGRAVNSAPTIPGRCKVEVEAGSGRAGRKPGSLRESRCHAESSVERDNSGGGGAVINNEDSEWRVCRGEEGNGVEWRAVWCGRTRAAGFLQSRNVRRSVKRRAYGARATVAGAFVGLCGESDAIDAKQLVEKSRMQRREHCCGVLCFWSSVEERAGPSRRSEPGFRGGSRGWALMGRGHGRALMRR